MHLSSIHIYPIKSTAPVDLPESIVEPRGLAHDRRFLVIDDKDRFLTARRYPVMVKIASALRDDGIEVTAPGHQGLRVANDSAGEPDREVTVWRSQVPAVDMGDAAAAWFSDVIGASCRLVFMGERSRREVDPDYARPGDEVSFADGYPLLVTSKSSLDDLNGRLDAPVTMRRFRPNLVVEGFEAYAEDGWKQLRIGDVLFDAAKPCDRCVFTTIDPVEAVKDPAGEPLKTLGTYRDDPERGILFGVNVIPRSAGVVREGDAITLLD